uniref:hypothetical protein n=1 Tax=Bakuella subtropica TaxID=1295181 RepID=UPI0023F2E14C|nr:hypothetical protein P4D19_mgp03 [Bakuella subtropica]WDY80861.1 hypothetical protein BKSUB_04 [Bakuella subtropica]
MFFSALKRLKKAYNFIIDHLILPTLESYFSNMINAFQNRLKSSIIGRWLYENIPRALNYTSPEVYNFLNDCWFLYLRHKKVINKFFFHYTLLAVILGTPLLLVEITKEPVTNFILISYEKTVSIPYAFFFPYCATLIKWIGKYFTS